ncbi:MAG: hypothetical protein E5X86_19780 [Mesorhizobium sp.]|uniref:hypothetical protein n=1 Tax=Mesorhizobium sp. TaxID=1871066 RepID=UPI001217054C|nr:hypothetical protein [Mesorhizobium sp.]TIO15612.1 MAG: hypothetical protein E5X86_19780 [Mesorhizobium sp.]
MNRKKLTSEQRAAIVLERRKARQKVRDAMNREMSSNKAAAGVTFLHGRVDESVAAARLAEIPPDTRDLTQRVCGDPIFERSALYKRLFQSG